MKNRVFLLLLIFITLLLSACTENQTHYKFYDDFQGYYQQPFEINIDDFENITDLAVNEHYKNYYGWAHLKNHEVFWDERNNQVVVNLAFSIDAPLWEVDSARKYGKDTFLNKLLHNLSPHTYQLWVHGVEIDKILVQVFADEKLLLQDYYEGSRAAYSISHYENIQVFFNGQILGDELNIDVNTMLTKYLPPKYDVIVTKSIVEEKSIVQIKSVDQVNPDNLEAVRVRLKPLCEKYDSVDLVLCDDLDAIYYEELIND